MLQLIYLTTLFTAPNTMPLKLQSSVDYGISVHNYKHHNKAEIARAINSEKAGIIEVFKKDTTVGGNAIPKTTTPKYAAQPASLVIRKLSPKDGVLVNPLTSPRNYKASPAATKKHYGQ